MESSGLPILRNDAAVRAAYAAHGAELYRYALRALGDGGAAEEAVQETFLRAWRSAERYDPSRASLRVWLFAILRNAVIDAGRARRARPWTQYGEQLTAAHEPEASHDAVDQMLDSLLIEEALTRISPDHRVVIVQTYVRGRPADEVAAELGIPPGTLRSRLFYGLKALRVAMDEMGWTP